MRLHVEIEGEPSERRTESGGGELAAFMSFANLRGFGATHPLIALADRLAEQHRVSVGPLTIFYGHDSEDAEDREKLEYAWQDSALLRDTLRATLQAIATDPQCQTLLRRAHSPALLKDLEQLVAITIDAATDGKRIRLSFSE